MWLLLDQRGYWEDCGRPGTSENDKTKEENIHNKVMLALNDFFLYMYNRNIAHDNLKVYTMYAVLNESFAMLKPDPNFVSINRFMKKKYTENFATFFYKY